MEPVPTKFFTVSLSHFSLLHLSLLHFLTFSLSSLSSLSHLFFFSLLFLFSSCRPDGSHRNQPSAEIVRVETLPPARNANLTWARSTLCGDRARRDAAACAKRDFNTARANPLRRSCASRLRNLRDTCLCARRTLCGDGARRGVRNLRDPRIYLASGEPSAKIVRVEAPKPARNAHFERTRSPLRGSCTSRRRNLRDTRIWSGRGAPSAAIVRVEEPKPARYAHFVRTRRALCGDRARRGAKPARYAHLEPTRRALCGDRARRGAETCAIRAFGADAARPLRGSGGRFPAPAGFRLFCSTSSVLERVKGKL